MVRLVLRSSLVLVGSALGGSVVVFLLLRLLPGDLATVILGDYANPQAAAQLREEFGLNRSWFEQYSEWITGIARGDLGQSPADGFDIAHQISARAGLTVSLAVISLVLSSILALGAGAYAAVHARHRRGVFVDVLAQLGVAVPTFWVGLLLVAFVSVRMGWLPAGGYIPWSESVTGAIRTLILPVLALTVSLSGVLARYVRSAVLDIVNEDYIRLALAKGRTLRGAVIVHGIRNASIPLVTVVTLALGGLLTGVAVIEVVFNLPGLGRLLLDAVSRRDVIVVQSLVFVFLLIILVLNFVMDIVYGLLDPRIRDSDRSA